MQKSLPFICIMGVHCCCLHINYIVYENFDRSLHVESSDPTYVQNFRPVPLTVLDTGIHPEEQEQQDILINFRCMLLFTNM